jgi:hypothetical protein
MSMLSAFLVGMNRHARAAEKAQEYMLRSRDFYSLVRDIDVLLSTPIDERGPYLETMSRLRNEFDRVQDMSLDPPLHIIQLYERKFCAIERDLYDMQPINETTCTQVPTPRPEADEQKNARGILTTLQETTAGMSDYMWRKRTSNHGGGDNKRRSIDKRIQNVVLTPYHLYSNPVHRGDIELPRRLQSFSTYRHRNGMGENVAVYLETGVDISTRRPDTITNTNTNTNNIINNNELTPKPSCAIDSKYNTQSNIGVQMSLPVPLYSDTNTALKSPKISSSQDTRGNSEKLPDVCEYSLVLPRGPPDYSPTGGTVK